MKIFRVGKRTEVTTEFDSQRRTRRFRCDECWVADSENDPFMVMAESFEIVFDSTKISPKVYK